MLFGFISNVPLGPLTTRRAVLLFAFISIISKKNSLKVLFKSINRSDFSIALSFLFCSLFLTFFHTAGTTQSDFTDYFEPREIVTLFINILVMGLWCVLEIKSFTRFAGLVVGVMLTQSVFTFVTAVYPPLRIYVAENFMSASYLERAQDTIYGLGGRAAGFGIAWSSGALILAFGCFILIAMKQMNAISTMMFSISFALIISATALMGRTGLIAGLLFLFYYGVSSGRAKNIFAVSLVAIVGFIVLNQVLSMYDAQVAAKTMDWIMEFTNSDRVEEINSKVVDDGFPPLSSDFIFGTGLKHGHFKNYRFTADSGYIHCYTSIGVVGMFFYYVGLLYLFLSVMSKKIEKNMRKLIWVAIVIMFAVEYKEPYIGMGIYPWIIFTTALFLNKNTKLNKNENINSWRFLSESQSKAKVGIG